MPTSTRLLSSRSPMDNKSSTLVKSSSTKTGLSDMSPSGCSTESIEAIESQARRLCRRRRRRWCAAASFVTSSSEGNVRARGLNPGQDTRAEPKLEGHQIEHSRGPVPKKRREKSAEQSRPLRCHIPSDRASCHPRSIDENSARSVTRGRAPRLVATRPVEARSGRSVGENSGCGIERHLRTGLARRDRRCKCLCTGAR